MDYDKERDAACAFAQKYYEPYAHDTEFKYIRANAIDILNKNDNITHYQIYIIAKNIGINNDIFKYSKELEEFWQCKLI